MIKPSVRAAYYPENHPENSETLMEQCYMLTLIGQDRPGIVARVTRALFDHDCNLGAASMVRLGGNFTVMLTVLGEPDSQADIEALLAPIAADLDLHTHVDVIAEPAVPAVNNTPEPDLRITVYGADRPGIVAHVAEALAALGANILNLETAIAGQGDEQVYLLHIESQCPVDEDTVRAALEGVRRQGIEVNVTSVQTLVS